MQDDYPIRHDLPEHDCGCDGCGYILCESVEEHREGYIDEPMGDNSIYLASPLADASLPSACHHKSTSSPFQAIVKSHSLGSSDISATPQPAQHQREPLQDYQMEDHNQWKTARLSISSTFTSYTSSSVQNQRYAFLVFNLLYGICKEAARRKWVCEVEKIQVARLTSVRCSRHRKSSRYDQGARDSRYAPYLSQSRDGSRTSGRCEKEEPDDDHGLSPEPRSLMAYISLIANATWQNTRNESAAPHRAELRSAQKMSDMCELAGRITESLDWGGEMGNVEGGLMEEDRTEHRAPRLVRQARRLCSLLGYDEGRTRCEEVCRSWCGVEEVV